MSSPLEVSIKNICPIKKKIPGNRSRDKNFVTKTPDKFGQLLKLGQTQIFQISTDAYIVVVLTDADMIRGVTQNQKSHVVTLERAP